MSESMPDRSQEDGTLPRDTASLLPPPSTKGKCAAVHQPGSRPVVLAHAAIPGQSHAGLPPISHCGAGKTPRHFHWSTVERGTRSRDAMSASPTMVGCGSAMTGTVEKTFDSVQSVRDNLYMGTTNSTAPILRCVVCKRPIRRNATYLLVHGEPRHQTCHNNEAGT